MKNCRPSWSCWLASLITLAAWLVLALSSCVPVTEQADPNATISIDYNKQIQRHIYNMQDQLQVDSLIAFLDAPEPEYRYLAARAFGSVISDSAIAPLSRLLLDPIDLIRATAAYALGQQGEPRSQGALLQAFDFRDTAGVYERSNAAILEAIGKVGDTSMLNALTSITTYLPTDTLLLLGQARGIYRFGTRNIISKEATALMCERALSAKWPSEVRLIAAHYLQRCSESLDGVGLKIIARLTTENEVGIRMPLSRALGKTYDNGVTEGLINRFRVETDPLVHVELLRALAKHPYEKTRETLLEAVKDDNFMVAQTAAEILKTAGIPSDATQYWQLAKDSSAVLARPQLYAAALHHLPPYLQDYRSYINSEIRRRFGESTNPYEKAALLKALAEYPWNFRFLIEQALSGQENAVTTAAAEAIDAIVAQPMSVEYFRSNFPAVKRELAAFFTTVFAGNNSGLQAIAATTLGRKAWNFQTEYTSLDFLDRAKEQLTLPRDTETAYFIEDAKAALIAGYIPQKPKPPYNHPINWDIYRSLQPDLEVVVETPRGTIIIDLLEEYAPGSVVNFVQSVRNGFYNGKVFHRIVPAFVTQGGCPRGDGFGSLDYTLRTETPQLYYDAPGYIGMASAGRHTEGVQFFFTHQATPHLDGRYTIFGKVIQGMEVVNKLQLGDDMRVKLR